MHSLCPSTRWFAAIPLVLPLVCGCRVNEPSPEIDFFEAVNINAPLVIRVNSKSEMLIHGKWVPIYDKPKTVDTWFARQADRYRQAYQANHVELKKEKRLGKEVVLLPAKLIIEVDSTSIKSGIVNSMKRRAREVGFYQKPQLQAPDGQALTEGGR